MSSRLSCFAICSWYTYGGFLYWFLCLQHGEHWPRVTRHVSKLLPFRVLIRSSLVLILLHCTYWGQNWKWLKEKIGRGFLCIFFNTAWQEDKRMVLQSHMTHPRSVTDLSVGFGGWPSVFQESWRFPLVSTLSLSYWRQDYWTWLDSRKWFIVQLVLYSFISFIGKKTFLKLEYCRKI